MMYILTEEEYLELKAKKTFELKISKDKLQKLCTKIADTWIVEEGWYKGKVWGCILTVNGEWYCDECVVKDICPLSNKHWSK